MLSSSQLISAPPLFMNKPAFSARAKGSAAPTAAGGATLVAVRVNPHISVQLRASNPCLQGKGGHDKCTARLDHVPRRIAQVASVDRSARRGAKT